MVQCVILNFLDTLNETQQAFIPGQSFIVEVKLRVVSVGVHLETIVLSYGDDISCSIHNKK